MINTLVGKTISKIESKLNYLLIVFTDNTTLEVSSEMEKECYHQAINSCCNVGTDTILDIEITP